MHDRYYGTSKKAVHDSLAAGNDLVLIIDVQGADTWRKIAELRKRLVGRATESEADIDRRMKTAVDEFKQADKFDRRIESKTKDEDYAALKKIYLELKNR